MTPRHLLNPWPTDPRSLRNWQLARLRAYLRDVVLPFSAHYGPLFASERIDPEAIQTADDMSRIPFTSKCDLVPTPEHPERTKEFVIIPDKAVLSKRPGTIVKALLRGKARVAEEFDREFRPVLLTSTTGRSSEPVPFLYTMRDVDNLRIGGARVMSICNSNREMRMLNMFPFAPPHLAFWITHYAGKEFGVFVLDSGGGKTMGTDGNLRLIRKIKPDVIIGMPTFMYHVLQSAVADGVKLPNLCKIVLGGEKAPSGMRRKLRELARQLGAERVDVLRTFGFTEAKLAWAECPFAEDAGSAGYHIHPDMSLIEIVDPKTGELRGEGEPGEIVFTPLAARGSVVLRYRTGDCTDGGLVHEQCPYCGVHVPRLVGEISRSSEVREMNLGKLKGTLVDFNQLEHVLDNAEHVGTWQLELRKRNDDPLDVDELVLHVAKSDSTSDAQLREGLDNRFASETEIHLNRIEFHTVEEMRSKQGIGTQLKEQRVVDHRPAGTPQAGEGAATKMEGARNG